MSLDHTILITSAGRVKFIWDDELVGLAPEGFGTLRRAAYVEPIPDGLGWLIDLAPLGLGHIGVFPTRGEALEVERELVNQQLVAGRL